LSEECLPAAERAKLQLQQAREAAARHESDCGSSEVQASVLTRRISLMTQHLKAHPKDIHSRLGLMAMLANRKRHLKYLRAKDFDTFSATIRRLGLKDLVPGRSY
jgi:small subunit ribosomal protein S15